MKEVGLNIKNINRRILISLLDNIRKIQNMKPVQKENPEDAD